MSIDKLESIKDTASRNSLELVISDLHTVQGHTQLMNYIIDDVLTYRKIKEGKVQVNTEVMPFSELVKSLDKTVSAKIRENPNVTFCMNTEKGLTITGDKFRISQILLNLVNNSIKFTNQGTITLDAYEKDGMCEFRVTDTGCGVDPKLEPQLFGEFIQGRTSPSNSPTLHGSGLGLYICKNLTKLMGGTIEHIRHNNGIGAIFCVRLPLGLDAELKEEGNAADVLIPVTESTV